MTTLTATALACVFALPTGCDTSFSKGTDDGDGGGVDSGALCGDGVVGGGEGCDDGNTDPGDGCDEGCGVEAGWSCEGEPSVCTQSCGDGEVQAGEECDGEDMAGESCESVAGGYAGGTLGCKVDCTFDTANCVLPGCGDGVQDLGEECDDGNDSNTDGCLNNCRLATCGDGYVNAGVEECDDVNSINTDGCLNTCQAASCGDGFVWSGHEQCDDGNDDDTDGCPSSCVAATCGDGYVWSGHEQCDDGNDDNTDGCLNDCQAASCGDGFVWPGHEQCDDGDSSNNDGCLNNCQPASCGDGFVWSGHEQCDDGDSSNNDGCLNNCQPASCGDGYVWSGHEQCDDGATVSGDGCSSTCQQENLPVLYWIQSTSSGWSQQTITYAGDPHAPTTDIIAAANVQKRDEIYFFTRTTYHLLSIPGRNWIAHGDLTSRFSGVPAATFHAAYGVSWEHSTESTILFFNGSQYYLYNVNNSTGGVSPDSGNPGTTPWDVGQPMVPDPSEVVAGYVDLGNNQGWVDCSPFQLCGSGGSTTGPYSAFLTTSNRIHIQESGVCFEFCSEYFASSFEPFGLTGAPPYAYIQAMAYGDGVLYVVTQN